MVYIPREVEVLLFSMHGKMAIVPPGVGGRQVPSYQVGWQTGFKIILSQP